MARTRPYGQARVCLLFVGSTLILPLSCAPREVRSARLPSRASSQPSLAPPALQSSRPARYPGLANVVAYSPWLMSGSAPEGAAGFESLQKLGVRTIVSVDGAAPEVGEARAHEIRYVHLPIGYNGMDHQRTLEIARAIELARARDPGAPVYVHCHHGKHRSAGASGAAAVTLGLLSAKEALARMTVSGTAANYTGLFRCVSAARPASAEELRAAGTEFPEVFHTDTLVQTMVEIDECLERLKAVEKAGWKTPADHPDVVPAAEAGRLADLLRWASDGDRAKAKPAGFRAGLMSASKCVEAVEDGLVHAATAAELSQRFKLVCTSCTDCHAMYRD